MSTETIVYIYGLAHPDTGVIHYVGKSEDLKARMYQHFRTKNKKDAKSKWIAELVAQGKKPQMIVIEECTPDTWQDAERRWIAHYRAVNTAMVNGSKGGYGNKQNRFPERLPVIKITREIRARLNQALEANPCVTEAEIVRRAVGKFLDKMEKSKR